jgi:hypothetical protein
VTDSGTGHLSSCSSIRRIFKSQAEALKKPF